jgi:hypothetical protein
MKLRDGTFFLAVLVLVSYFLVTLSREIIAWNTSTHTAINGQTLTAAKWNTLIADINTLKITCPCGACWETQVIDTAMSGNHSGFVGCENTYCTSMKSYKICTPAGWKVTQAPMVDVSSCSVDCSGGGG